jgi:type III pantothenate kinase
VLGRTPILCAMLLAVDVGNTHTQIGCFSGSELRESWRMATEPSATADELALMVSGLGRLSSMEFDGIDEAIVSSVVPRLASQYALMCQRYLNVEALTVGPLIRTAMPILTESPHELGADRIVNAVAAHQRFAGPCVVVDFGTAITYDAVSAAGEYMGGAIAPGIEISIEALASRTAKLPKVDLSAPATAIGRSTQQSIQAGIVYGFAGQVDGIVRRIVAALGGGASVVATGGGAAEIVPFCEASDALDELLTLKGLLLIHQRNR